MKAHRVLKAPMADPADIDAVEAEIDAQGVDLERVRAVMCMTEGDGLARGYASLAFSNLYHHHLGWDVREVPRRVPLIMIGGCSGLVSPYAALFVEEPSFEGDSEDGGLAIGISTTADVDIEAFGTVAMVDMVADAVTTAMDEAAIASPEDVHCVQIKAPWPATPDLLRAEGAGKRVATLDGDRAGALARGAGALGVAVAMGEVDRGALTDADIATDLHLRSDVASASAGTERTNVAVLVLGNSRRSKSPYRIGHGILSDGIDVAGVYRALASAGIGTDSPLAMGEENPIDHVFVKSAVDLGAMCRGRRHVLKTDYLGPYSWLIAKAVVHATVAGIVGDPMMQVSGGGEHQGPVGGGLVAVVARK
jgi:cyanuric acid amidohydrolase